MAESAQEGAIVLPMIQLMLCVWACLAGVAVSSSLDYSWAVTNQDAAPQTQPAMRMRVANSVQCRVLCQRTTLCLAVAFLPAEKQCWLFQEPATSLVFRPGALYFMRDQQRIVDPNCSDGQTEVTTDRSAMRSICICISCQSSYTDAYCSEPPPSLHNGHVAIQSGSQVGAEAVYECNSGLVFVGENNVAVCGVNGSWTGLNGECRNAYCSEPLPSLQYGQVAIQSGSQVGAEAVYECNSSLVFVGDSNVAVCGVNGSWTGLAGECRTECSPPPSFPNVTRTYTSTWAGSEASYTCSGAVVLDLVCTDSGVWENARQSEYVYNAGAGIGIRISSNRQRWLGAEENCNAHCGSLAVFDSDQKVAFSRSVLPVVDTSDFWSCLYVGLLRGPDDSWTWLGGTPLQISSNSWCPGQPNNRQNEDCGVWGNTDPEPCLHDAHCSFWLSYACTITEI